MRTDVLRIKMIEMGIRGEDLAKAANISPSTFYRKMGTGGFTFTIEQALKIAEKLALTKEESCGIFLS